MSIEAAIVARAGAVSGLTDLIGERFYPVDEAPQPGVLPYVTYTVIDHPRVHVMSRDSLAQPRVQFDCFAETRAGARALGDAVVDAFDRWRGAAAGVTVDASVCENGGLDFDREDTSLRPRRLVEFVITYVLS